jgi:hypothetical protein
VNILVRETGKYQFNIFVRCLDCKKYRYGKNFSCDAYPKPRGIPGKVWSYPNAECPYFEKKEE